ncbi:hypothetical protein Nepgr_009358 [Nepenthes gracilis]|uniref:Uncharacterized protein n=1 Tax=Nepenthes gracilis TaxID=150966 RepID=A0AAD3SAG5_NEPGR|nr:hypothetical protein Nepgr_009358 [Nepenthes gracilis]
MGYGHPSVNTMSSPVLSGVVANGLQAQSSKAVNPHVDEFSDVTPCRMSRVCSSQAVILPYTKTVPVSDDIAAFAIASLSAVSNSNPQLIAVANFPRASWSSVVQ